MQSAKAAFPAWANTPPMKRARVMFKFKELLDKHAADLAREISREHGKVHDDALGEVARGIDCVDFACGIPQLLKGEFSRNVGPAIDSYSDRQPLGVVAGITPFNFPAMVPMWMYPIAIACGNTFILKPSERDPSAPMLAWQLFMEAGLPEGVLNVVHGDKEAVDAILDHPDIKAVSFVGSTPIAEYVYRRGTHGREARAGAGRRQEPHDRHARRRHGPGGRRADGRGLRLGRRALHGDLGRGAGGRGDRRRADRASCKPRVESLKIGPATDPDAEMGPVVTKAHRDKIVGYIDAGVEAGRRARRRRPRLQAAGLRERLLRRRHAVRPRDAGHEDLPRGDLRAGALGGPRRRPTRTRSI